MKALLLLSLVFGACSAIQVNIDYSRATDLKDHAEKAQKTVADWYDRAAKYFNSPQYEPPPRIEIKWDKIDPPAYAYRDNRVGYIVASINHCRAVPGDYGMYIHEAMHIITQGKDCPGWISEGLADWVRWWKYERKPASKPRPDENYTAGYGVAGYFFDYVSRVYNKPRLDYDLNRACLEGKYNDNIWVQQTGKKVDDLYEEMRQKG